MNLIHPTEVFMKVAIGEAIQSKIMGDYAIGAAIFYGGRRISASGNRVKINDDPTAHAEMLAIREASSILENRHLNGCFLYTTHEPCPMCYTAAIYARMDGIVFGAHIEDMKAYSLENGNSDWSWRTIELPVSEVFDRVGADLKVIKGFMRDECKALFHS